MRNRWVVAAAAFLLYLCLGAVYTFSIWKKVLIADFWWWQTEVMWIFSLAIWFLGIAAAVGGRFVERYGARRIARLAAVFYGLGLLGSWLAVAVWSLRLLYLTYGVLSGIGIWLWYVCPLSTVLKRFPAAKWFASGIIVFWFWLSSLVFGPVITFLLPFVQLSGVFRILWVLFFLLLLLAAQFIVPPTKSRVDPALPKPQEEHVPTPIVHIKKRDLTGKQALKTVSFWLLWGMFCINLLGGITLIGNAAPLGQEMVGMSTGLAVLMVGLMGTANGLGRFWRASSSDVIGRFRVYFIFFCLQLVLFFFLPFAPTPWSLIIPILVILSCYGGWFSCMPPLLTELFGSSHVSQIRGYMLTAWSVAGVLGPILGVQLHQMTGNYIAMVYVLGGFFVFALILLARVYRIYRKLPVVV